jgi:hypothetical protein
MVFLARGSLDRVDFVVYSARGTLITFSIPETIAREIVGSGDGGDHQCLMERAEGHLED